MATELCSDTLLTATVRKAKFDIIYAMSVFTLTSFNFPNQSYKCCAVSVMKYLNDMLNSLKVLPTIVSCHKRCTAVSQRVCACSEVRRTFRLKVTIPDGSLTNTFFVFEIEPFSLADLFPVCRVQAMR